MIWRTKMQAKVQDKKKWQIKAKPTLHHYLEGVSIGSNHKPKKRAQKKAHDLENQEAS